VSSDIILRVFASDSSLSNKSPAGRHGRRDFVCQAWR
jgi:hypothetical protein